MHLRLVSLAAALLLGACGGSITACSEQPDVSGKWSLALVPLAADAGVAPTIPGAVSVEAELEQLPATDVFRLVRPVAGSLTASDASYFGALAIPRLTMNDGGKSGAILGCSLRINVPIASPVSDDNVDQGPLRIALAGKILEEGRLTGIDGSLLILASDPSNTPRTFGWTGVQR